MIKALLLHVSKDPTRPNLQGVNVTLQGDDIKLTATDGHTLIEHIGPKAPTWVVLQAEFGAIIPQSPESGLLFPKGPARWTDDKFPNTDHLWPQSYACVDEIRPVFGFDLIARVGKTFKALKVKQPRFAVNKWNSELGACEIDLDSPGWRLLIMPMRP